MYHIFEYIHMMRDLAYLWLLFKLLYGNRNDGGKKGESNRVSVRINLPWEEVFRS